MKKRFLNDIPLDEAKLQKTIELSKAAFVSGESEGSVSHVEFLYQQSRYIKKHWWLMQAVLLLALCLLLQMSGSDLYTRRSLGIAAPLFVILVLPELWKNRNTDAMEIEGTTFYTIRQIYAARLTLFAGVDLILLSLFFVGASALARVTVWELMIQFVLPFNVACCLCFHGLYNNRTGSEPFSILLCSVWTGLWVLIVLRDAVYDRISVPVWITLLAASFAYLGFSILRGQKEYRKTWEAKAAWN